MSQLFGYLSSNDMLTQAVMAQVGHELQAVPLQDRSGLGLGWIQDGRSLLRKHPPKRAATADVASLVTDLPARAIVGHVRHASLGAVTSNELQPFRFRTWLYAQGGLNEGLENLARTFRKEIPDHIRRNIKGRSNAELIFHLFCARHEANFEHGTAEVSARRHAVALADTMLYVEDRIREEQGDEGAPFLVIAATEKLLLAARIGAEPMHYRFFEGIDEPAEKPLFAGHRPKPVHHKHFSGLIVANKIDDTAQWQELPDRHILWVEPKWRIRTAPLDHMDDLNIEEEE